MLDYVDDDNALRDPAKLVQDVVAAGEAWADAEAAAQSMEDTRKSLLAELALAYQAASRGLQNRAGLSQAAAESHALADPKYAAHVELTVELRRQANKLRVRYDLGKMYIELLRSREATRRAEARL